MNIVIINQHRDDELGGSEIQCDFIAEELTNRGHQVVYLAPGGRKREYNKNYRVVPCKMNLDDIAGSVIRESPDIVYWRINKNFFYPTVKTIRRSGIPIVFAVSHVNDVTKWRVRRNVNARKKISHLLKDRWQHRGFWYVDALTANNKNNLGKTEVSIQRYIPNGMKSSFEPFNWQKPYVAWIANIKSSKRPELYIELAKEFEFSGTDFLMAGNIQDSQYNWIQEKEKLPSNFYYLGSTTLEESSGIIASSEFLVHTCYPEGFPNVFIQSWMQGKPTVSFGFDPCGYIVDRGLGYCSDEDRQAFIQQVHYLLDHPTEKHLIGENAARFAREMFSVTSMVDSLETLFAEVISGITGEAADKGSGTL